MWRLVGVNADTGLQTELHQNYQPQRNQIFGATREPMSIYSSTPGLNEMILTSQMTFWNAFHLMSKAKISYEF